VNGGDWAVDWSSKKSPKDPLLGHTIKRLYARGGQALKEGGSECRRDESAHASSTLAALPV
jgi:hypothetical protein